MGRVGPTLLDVIAQLQQSSERLVTISSLIVKHRKNTICASVPLTPADFYQFQAS